MSLYQDCSFCKTKGSDLPKGELVYAVQDVGICTICVAGVVADIAKRRPKRLALVKDKK